MKRVVAFVLSAIVLSGIAISREAPEPMFPVGSLSFGPYAGITYGSISPDEPIDGISWAMGIAAGLDARYYLCETSNLQLGVRYEQRASKQSVSSPFTTSESTEKRNYLMFDLTSSWYFANMCDGGFRPRIYGGVFIGSFLSGTTKSTYTVGGGAPQTTEMDIASSEVNTLNWGPKLGVGFDWKMGPGALTFGVSYDYGMANLAPSTATSSYKFYDRGISAGLGYQIGF